MVLLVPFVCAVGVGSVPPWVYSTLCQAISTSGCSFMSECEFLCPEDQGSQSEIGVSDRRQ